MSPRNLLKPLRNFARGRTGTILRNLTGIRPYPFNVPPYSQPVSDSFLWRCDAEWKTGFHLMNALSLLEPEHPCRDIVTVVAHSSDGKEIARETVTLGEFETRSLFLSDLTGKNSGFGFFTAFHFPEKGTRPTGGKTCVVERNYVGYRRTTDPEAFWSYVHGNSYVFAMDRRSAKLKPLHRLASKPCTYAPQLRFDDCLRFELAYVNPMPHDIDLEVEDFDERGQRMDQRKVKLSAHQSLILNFDQTQKPVVTVRNLSRIAMWRPLIFKHYESHFDVFHG